MRPLDRRSNSDTMSSLINRKYDENNTFNWETKLFSFVGRMTSDKDYYNDLPGKVPPELFCDSNLPSALTRLNIQNHRERLSSNLIDLNSPPAEHNYVNEKYTESNCNNNSSSGGGGGASSTVRDLFDIPSPGLSAEIQRSQLMTELWFHGAISRAKAESLLERDGDFLVRESQGTHGQYVLTGMQATPKHLLLMDGEGCVRTKDRLFESISHLINYHLQNALPIVSAESTLLLRNPIHKINID